MSETKLSKTQEIHKPVHKRLYTLREASVYLGRPVFSVRTLIWGGKLPYIQTGRKQYIDISDLNKYVERNKQTMV